MKNKKPTQKEMIETLGRALMSFAMCRDKGVEAPEFNGTGYSRLQMKLHQPEQCPPIEP